VNQHDDVICQVRESFSGLSMDTPVEQVFARSRVRRRRQLSGLAAAGTATTAGAAAAITLTLGGPAPAHLGTPLPAHPHEAKLAAFSVTSGPGGSTTLSVHKGRQYQRLDPAAVRRALARHGIPALVTVGTFCRPSTAPTAGPNKVVHASPPVSRPGPARGSALVIIGRAMKPGTKLSIGLFPGYVRSLPVKNGSHLTCSSGSRQPAAHIPPTGSKIRR
jgi:hypothetical protein